MTTFWSLWIIVLTSSCIILVTWVLLANRRAAVHPGLDPDDKTTGHVYDGIVEYKQPTAALVVCDVYSLHRLCGGLPGALPRYGQLERHLGLDIGW